VPGKERAMGAAVGVQLMVLVRSVGGCSSPSTCLVRVWVLGACCLVLVACCLLRQRAAGNGCGCRRQAAGGRRASSSSSDIGVRCRKSVTEGEP